MPAITILIVPIRLQFTNKIPCRFAYGTRPHYWHYTATQTTLSLVPYYYLHRQTIVPICLQSTDRPIDELYVQLLSLPPLVPYYRPNRQQLCHCTYSRPNDYANTPAIPIIVMPISLRPKYNQVELCSLKYNPVASTVLLVLEYIERGYIVTCLRIAVLHTKKKLPVSEYMDKGYIDTYL